MAASCLDVITYAMRQCRIIGPGKTPKDAEAEEGLAALQALYDQWRTGGMLGSLCDKYLADGAVEDAQEGYRYYLTSGATLNAATNDYVPQYGDAYSECDYASGIGPVRQPRDMALYESVDNSGNQTAKLYDRTQWVDLLDLELTDVAPLSGRNAYGLAACLATSGGFVSVFGAEPSQSVIALARHFLRNVMGKVGSTQDSSGADYF